jgi:hypothetical protein
MTVEADSPVRIPASLEPRTTRIDSKMKLLEVKKLMKTLAKVIVWHTPNLIR